MDDVPQDQIGKQFRRGSPDAVDRVGRRVRRILAFRGYSIPAEDRRDLEQQVMTQLWQTVNSAGFDPQRSFWGFVEVVTARRCIDWLRGRRHEAYLPEAVADDPGPQASALRDERRRLGRQALDRLGEPCRKLIRLQVGEGRSYRELAALLGKSEGALRVQMYRCIRQAQRIVAELTGGSAGGAARGGE